MANDLENRLRWAAVVVRDDSGQPRPVNREEATMLVRSHPTYRGMRAELGEIAQKGRAAEERAEAAEEQIHLQEQLIANQGKQYETLDQAHSNLQVKYSALDKKLLEQEALYKTDKRAQEIAHDRVRKELEGEKEHFKAYVQDLKKEIDGYKSTIARQIQDIQNAAATAENASARASNLEGEIEGYKGTIADREQSLSSATALASQLAREIAGYKLREEKLMQGARKVAKVATGIQKSKEELLRENAALRAYFASQIAPQVSSPKRELAAQEISSTTVQPLNSYQELRRSRDVESNGQREGRSPLATFGTAINDTETYSVQAALVGYVVRAGRSIGAALRDNYELFTKWPKFSMIIAKPAAAPRITGEDNVPPMPEGFVPSRITDAISRSPLDIDRSSIQGKVEAYAPSLVAIKPAPVAGFRQPHVETASSETASSTYIPSQPPNADLASNGNRFYHPEEIKTATPLNINEPLILGEQFLSAASENPNGALKGILDNGLIVGQVMSLRAYICNPTKAEAKISEKGILTLVEGLKAENAAEYTTLSSMFKEGELEGKLDALYARVKN